MDLSAVLAPDSVSLVAVLVSLYIDVHEMDAVQYYGYRYVINFKR